jgi:DNA-binding PadR family transcriptional regulator
VTGTKRPSPRTLAVLQALTDDPERWRYGYELCAELDMQAGSMYPILIRLADRGMLEAAWEDDPVPGRPARHLYRLTGSGHAYATRAAADHAAVSKAHRPAANSARPRRRPRLEGA